MISLLRGFGTYLLVAIIIWMVLTGGYGWADSSFGPTNEPMNAAESNLIFFAFPLIACCWPLILLGVVGIYIGGCRIGLITSDEPAS